MSEKEATKFYKNGMPCPIQTVAKADRIPSYLVSGLPTVRLVRVFLASDTLARMSISYDHVDSFANESFSRPQTMAKRELL